MKIKVHYLLLVWKQTLNRSSHARLTNGVLLIVTSTTWWHWMVSMELIVHTVCLQLFHISYPKILHLGDRIMADYMASDDDAFSGAANYERASLEYVLVRTRSALQQLHVCQVSFVLPTSSCNISRKIHRCFDWWWWWCCCSLSARRCFQHSAPLKDNFWSHGMVIQSIMNLDKVQPFFLGPLEICWWAKQWINHD